MKGELPQLPAELVSTILEETWLFPLSVTERINFTTACLLVSKDWSQIFSLISFEDLHILSLRYLEHYQTIVLNEQARAQVKYGCLPNVRCRSITVQSSLFDATARMAWRYHDNLRTMVHIYSQFSADDIFDHWTYANVPEQVTSLELHFVGEANMKSHRVSETLSNTYYNVAWAIPNLNRLSVIGGDARFLRHFLPAIVYRNLAVLETDFPIELEGIDFKFGNHKSYTLPAKLDYRLLGPNSYMIQPLDYT